MNLIFVHFYRVTTEEMQLFYDLIWFSLADADINISIVKNMLAYNT